MFYVIALLTGLLFGMGMALSGMIDPNLVIAFLDITGHWDPTLIFVMGGALMVFIPGYLLLIKQRQQPLLTETWSLNNNKTIDWRLIIGASLFGVGWGLLGVCPGPAITSLFAGNTDVWLFIAAMMAGLMVSKKLAPIAR
ncbi:DUF6691 family protein [Endozoicomonas sp.]|uniref:DUF6691 family protein n=1 Tax=Endozoicomonas sp. TaxID=1892382 RepID=UPI0028842EFD|nr:YeeE/YedE family protein [Endozoicomonas sp.]